MNKRIVSLRYCSIELKSFYLFENFVKMTFCFVVIVETPTKAVKCKQMFSDLTKLLNVFSQAFLYFNLLLILYVMLCKNTNNFNPMLYIYSK
jgi:hypothetical protein